MKPAKPEWDAAIAYAQKQLAGILPVLADLAEELPVEAEDLERQLSRLGSLQADERSHGAEACVDLVHHELLRAHCEGLSPSGAISRASPYVACLEILIEASEVRPVAFQALGIHAARLLSDNHEMIPQLRLFVADVLRGDRIQPSVRGTPRVHPSRDRVLYALLFEIVERFRVRPTRNAATTGSMSACDIVAEAMPHEARLPKSYSALARIWVEGQREERSQR